MEERISIYNDSRGYLSEIVNADNVSTITNKYDSYGRVISQTFPDESSMSYKYDDDRGRTVQTERNGAVSYHYNDSRLRTIKMSIVMPKNVSAITRKIRELHLLIKTAADGNFCTMKMGM